MIEDQVWSQYHNETRRELRQAFAMIAESGILQQQIGVEYQRLIEGDTEEDVEELAKRILKFRAETKGVQLIHDFGLQLLKEQEDE